MVVLSKLVWLKSVQTFSFPCLSVYAALRHKQILCNKSIHRCCYIEIHSSRGYRSFVNEPEMKIKTISGCFPLYTYRTVLDIPALWSPLCWYAPLPCGPHRPLSLRPSRSLNGLKNSDHSPAFPVYSPTKSKTDLLNISYTFGTEYWTFLT